METLTHPNRVVRVKDLNRFRNKLPNGTGVAYVPTLAAAPTAQTTTYTKDGKTVGFELGQFARVADASADEGYVFYQLYDLVTSGGVTTAKWKEANTGSGGNIHVSLAAVVNGSQGSPVLLDGVEVTLTNTTDNTTVATMIWHGSTLAFSKVVPLKNYSVSVQAKAGFDTPAVQTVTNLGIGEEVAKTFLYTADGYTVAITSNQDNDTAITSKTASLSYSFGGETVTESNIANGATVLVPTTATSVVFDSPDVAGYSKSISGAAISYATTILTVVLASDTGEADLSGVTKTVTDTTDSTTVTPQQDGTYKIPTGHGYSVSVSGDVEGYKAPDVATGTADSATATATMTYKEITLISGYIILDQTTTDPTKKVIDEGGHTYSGYQRPAVIDAIRAASHCYVGTFASNKMTLKQLDDTDGTKYADGTSAANDINSTSKNVFMRLPFFFTRVSTYATDKIKVEFAFDPNQTVNTTAQPDGTGWKQWGGNDLIGKYKGYSTGSKLYSISGQASTASISQANFKSYARALGTGFTAVKWRHQNIMAMLFYAYYGHTNCQSLIGSGTNSNNRTTGQKNSLGMTDTTSSNGNSDNIVFWGLENWWGDLYEWVDNVVVNSGTWVITEDDGTTRTPTGTMAAAGSLVYPSKFVLNDDLDVIGASGQTGGSDSTGYCDGQYIVNQGFRVVARSCSYAKANGGVAFVGADVDSSYTNTSNGSRLAFTGTIEIA